MPLRLAQDRRSDGHVGSAPSVTSAKPFGIRVGATTISLCALTHGQAWATGKWQVVARTTSSRKSCSDANIVAPPVPRSELLFRRSRAHSSASRGNTRRQIASQQRPCLLPPATPAQNQPTTANYAARLARRAPLLIATKPVLMGVTDRRAPQLLHCIK